METRILFRENNVKPIKEYWHFHRNHANTSSFFWTMLRHDGKSYNFLFAYGIICRKNIICFWTFFSIQQHFIYLHDWRVWLRIFFSENNIWHISLIRFPICQFFMLWHNTDVVINLSLNLEIWWKICSKFSCMSCIISLESIFWKIGLIEILFLLIE